MDLRNQLRIDVDFGKLLCVAHGHLRETLAKLSQELFQIQSHVNRTIGLQIAARAVIQFFRPTNVAVAKMKQRHRCLNQTLIKLSRLAAIIGPQILPRLVAFKKIALVEMLDPFQIERGIAIDSSSSDVVIPKCPSMAG